jgi:hypothetical protein
MLARVSWAPILDLPARQRALDIAATIGRALHEPPQIYAGQLADPALPVALLSREAGFAVCLAYLARSLDDPSLLGLARDHLDTALDVLPLAVEARRPYFAYGFAGLAWAVEHLQGWVIDVDPDALDDIDDAVLALVSGGAVSDFNLRNGLVGYAIYAFERLPRPTARSILEHVVERLLARAESVGNGIAWRLPRDELLPHLHERWPEGMLPRGIGDGAAGPIAILAACVRAGIAVEAAAAGVAAATRWLWSQPMHDGPATWVGGALGSAAALAANGVDGAIAQARASLALDGDFRDASLALGTAGAAHLANRLFHVSGEPVFLEASRRWFAHTIDRFDPSNGFGGFRFWSEPWQNDYIAEVPTGWIDNPGIAGGAAGIALALAAAATGVEPGWDRMLLASPLAPSARRGDAR